MAPRHPRRPRSGNRVELPSLRTMRGPLALVLTFVVVAVTAWCTAANYFLVERTPEAPVDTYLSYLEGGSSRQVMAPLLVDQESGLRQVLTNPAYRGAANRPQHHEFTGTRVTGDRAQVGVDVRLGDGTTVRREYPVEKDTAWGPFNDSWRLSDRDDVTVAVELPAAVDALAVNGQKVRPEAANVTAARGEDADPQARTWRFEGLPGQYDVALPEDSYLLAREHSPAVVSMADPQAASTRVDFEASPRMWEDVERAVQDAVGRCRSVLRFDAARCPLPRELRRVASSEGREDGTEGKRAEDAGEDGDTAALPEGVSAVRWELTSRPALLLEQDERDPLAFHAVPFRAAQAKVTWVEKGRTVSRPVSFDIEVTARTTGEHLDTDVQLRPARTRGEKGSRPS